MIGVCPLCGYNGELNIPSKEPTLYVCLRCFLTHYTEGVTPMGWDAVAGKSGGKKDPDTLNIAPNTAELVHVLMPDNEEPVSYWTHYIPNKSANGPKGRVVICPGRDTCPACTVGTYRTKRVHAINVWSYSAKAVKILEGGQTIFQALKQIKDQIGTLATVDMSIKKTVDNSGTSYMTIPIPMMQPFDISQVHGLFPIANLRLPNSAEEIKQIINQMEHGAPAPQREGPTPITQSIPPSMMQSGGTGDPLPQQPSSTCNSTPVFPFGKYKGRTVADVYSEDPNYVKWCADNITDATIKSEAKKLISTPQAAPQVAPSVISEQTQMQLMINEITDIIGNDPKYKGNYTIVLEKMRSVSKSPTHPNGKTLVNEYTMAELTALLSELKK